MKGQGLIMDESAPFCLWEDTFDEKPHSNNKLRGILAPAIEITTSMLDTDMDWESPHDFPPPVFEWWKGQKQILFHTGMIQGCSDVLLVYDEIQKRFGYDEMAHITTQKSLTLKHALLRCMVRQHRHLHLPSGKPNLFGKNEDYAALAHVRFQGEEVPRKCRDCNTPATTDEHPHYIIHGPGVMIAVRSYCKSCSQNAKPTSKRTKSTKKH